jgi:hypothetical protein
MSVKFKTLNQHERKQLIKLLHDAATSMSNHKSIPICSSYDDAEKLSSFIETNAKKLEQEEDVSLLNIWNIFAPTCDWDDAGGSVTLGNEIFNFLEVLRIKEKN